MSEKTGRELYNDKYDRLSLKRINKENAEWKLYGFYNSLIVNNSYKTAYGYISYVIEFLSGRVENPCDIDIDDYYSYMASIKNCSFSKQRGAYHALQRYSKYLKAKKICEDYMEFIERPKSFETEETVNKRENGYLTKKETKKFIENVNNMKTNDIWKSRNYALIMIFLTTGIRLSAMYKLDIQNIDLENKTITVYEKGGKNRTANIPDQTVEAIKIWIDNRNKLLKDNPEESAFIISNRKRRMEAESIYILIKKIGKVITGKNITPHKLRATYGTNLYEKTGDIYFVQQAMNHTSPKTTEIYIRGNKSEISQKAANIMEDFLK